MDSIQTNSIPIVCETPGCPNEGEVINRVEGISTEMLDAFFEDYDASDPEDICPLCHEPGIAGDPIPVLKGSGDGQ